VPRDLSLSLPLLRLCVSYLGLRYIALSTLAPCLRFPSRLTREVHAETQRRHVHAKARPISATSSHSRCKHWYIYINLIVSPLLTHAYSCYYALLNNRASLLHPLHQNLVLSSLHTAIKLSAPAFHQYRLIPVRWARRIYTRRANI